MAAIDHVEELARKLVEWCDGKFTSPLGGIHEPLPVRELRLALVSLDLERTRGVHGLDSDLFR